MKRHRSHATASLLASGPRHGPSGPRREANGTKREALPADPATLLLEEALLDERRVACVPHA